MIVTYKNNNISINKTKAQRYIELITELEPLERELKEELKQVMTEHNMTSIKSNGIKATLTGEYISRRFNTNEFKDVHPRLYKEFLKDTKVSSSLKLEV